MNDSYQRERAALPGHLGTPGYSRIGPAQVSASHGLFPLGAVTSFALIASVAIGVSATMAPLATLLGIAGLLIIVSILIWPYAGLFLITALTPFENVFNVTFLEAKSTKLGLLAFVVFVGVVRRLTQRVERIKSTSKSYTPPLLFFLASAALSTLLGSSPERSALGLVQLLLVYVFYLVVSETSLPTEVASRIFSLIMFLSVPLAVLAVLQAIWGYSVFGSASQQLLDLQGRYVTPLGFLQRGSATFDNPNAAGAFFSGVLAMAFLRVLVPRTPKLRYLTIGLLSGLGLLVTFSRGAMVGAACGLFFLLSISKISRLRRRLAFSFVGLFVALVLFRVPGEGAVAYFRPGPQGIAIPYSRLEAWQSGISIVKQHPVVGVGIYGFIAQGGVLRSLVEDPTVIAPPRHPHNGLLKALVEQGILGGLGYLYFLVTFLRISAASLRQNSTKLKHYWIFASIAYFGASLFGQELFDAGVTIGASSITVMFNMLLGIQISLRNFLGGQGVPVSKAGWPQRFGPNPSPVMQSSK